MMLEELVELRNAEVQVLQIRTSTPNQPLCHAVCVAVRPEDFQFLEKGQNSNFGYEIVISVKNPKFIL